MSIYHKLTLYLRNYGIIKKKLLKTCGSPNLSINLQILPKDNEANGYKIFANEFSCQILAYTPQFDENLLAGKAKKCHFLKVSHFSELV
jgi:hypothetical protein